MKANILWLTMLIINVSAQDILENCRAGDVCGDNEACIQRTVNNIKSTRLSTYKEALQTDVDLVKGNVNKKCYDADLAAPLLLLNGKRNPKTGVTAEYRVLWVDPSFSRGDGNNSVVNKYYQKHRSSATFLYQGSLMLGILMMGL